MRILFVGKRHPQQRDLITRPFGRFHHLPVALDALGHRVQVLLCSHHRLSSLHSDMATVDWYCEDIRTQGPLTLLRTLTAYTVEFRPDWVVGMSDAQYGWLAQRLARRCNARLAVDAYDNYEAYMPWNLPLHALWRRAVRAADLVTAAGPQLAQLLQFHRSGGHPVEILPMAADPEFAPRDKRECRYILGLPENSALVGYAGSWARNRGTSTLIEAFRYARAAYAGLQLVLSGRPPEYLLDEPGVIVMGYVRDEQLPALINALDIACVVTANTSFGRFSYPAKLSEAMACAVPVVATATAPVRWMLGERQDHLVPPGDAAAFAQRILALLESPKAEYGPRNTWTSQAEALGHLLASVEFRNRPGASPASPT